MAAETFKIPQANTFSVIPMLLWSGELILCSPPLSPGEQQQNKSKQALQKARPANRYCNWPLLLIFVCWRCFFSLWVLKRIWESRVSSSEQNRLSQGICGMHSVCQDDVVRTDVLQPSETTFDWGGPWKPLIRNYLKCSGEYLSLPFSPHLWGWKIHPCFQLLFTLKAAAWTWRSDQNSCCTEPETHCSLRTGSCRKRWYWSRAQHCILLTRHSQVHFSYRYNTGA